MTESNLYGKRIKRFRFIFYFPTRISLFQASLKQRDRELGCGVGIESPDLFYIDLTVSEPVRRNGGPIGLCKN